MPCLTLWLARGEHQPVGNQRSPATSALENAPTKRTTGSRKTGLAENQPTAAYNAAPDTEQATKVPAGPAENIVLKTYTNAPMTRLAAAMPARSESCRNGP